MTGFNTRVLTADGAPADVAKGVLCSITFTAANPPVVLRAESNGFLTPAPGNPVTRNGAGDYTVTLLEQLDCLGGSAAGINATAQVQMMGSAYAVPAVEMVDTTHYRVRLFDAAGAAVDADAVQLTFTQDGS